MEWTRVMEDVFWIDQARQLILPLTQVNKSVRLMRDESDSIESAK